MPIFTCPYCHSPTRFATIRETYTCAKCKRNFQSEADRQPPKAAAEETDNSSVPKPKKRKSEPQPQIDSIPEKETATVTNFVDQTTRTNLGEELYLERPTADSLIKMATMLPPKFNGRIDFNRWLPPKRHAGLVVTGAASRRALLYSAQSHKEVESEFSTTEKQIGYVTIDGEQIEFPIPNRRTRLRYRAVFNIVAMLVCVAILYLAFLLIAPK